MGTAYGIYPWDKYTGPGKSHGETFWGRLLMFFLGGWGRGRGDVRASTAESFSLWTKIPDPPIHFSGPTNFFGPKIDFTNHQFETSVFDPPMSSGLSRTTKPW